MSNLLNSRVDAVSADSNKVGIRIKVNGRWFKEERDICHCGISRATSYGFCVDCNGWKEDFHHFKMNFKITPENCGCIKYCHTSLPSRGGDGLTHCYCIHGETIE